MKDFDTENDFLNMKKGDIYKSTSLSSNVKKWDKKTLDRVQAQILFWSMYTVVGKEGAKVILGIDKLINEMKEECLSPEEMTTTFKNKTNMEGE